MTPSQPETITPERQIAASNVGAVFTSVHEYLHTLMHKNEDGVRLTSQPLEYARKALEEASFWSIKHVLMHGAPKPAAANDKQAQDVPAGPDAPVTPASIGIVDPPQSLPTDNGGTPSESM